MNILSHKENKLVQLTHTHHDSIQSITFRLQASYVTELKRWLRQLSLHQRCASHATASQEDLKRNTKTRCDALSPATVIRTMQQYQFIDLTSNRHCNRIPLTITHNRSSQKTLYKMTCHTSRQTHFNHRDCKVRMHYWQSQPGLYGSVWNSQNSLCRH